MAVTSQNAKQTSLAAPGSTVFPYAFKVIVGTDLRVKVDGVTKTLNADYTLSGVGLDGGGDVTFLTPLVGGELVVRERAMNYSRSTDYQNLGDLQSATLNNDQDAPVLMIQQVADGLAQAITVPDAFPSIDPQLPAPEALAPLVWSASGTGFENGSTTLTGDMLLRPNLATNADGKGAALVDARPVGIGWGDSPAAPSKGFNTDLGAGANVQRLRDRVFIGGGAEYGGAWASGAGSTSGITPEAQKLHNWAARDSQVWADSDIASLAITGHSQSSKQTAYPGYPVNVPAAIGVAGFSINDAVNGQGWGVYGEAVRMPGSNFTVGAEFAVANLGAVTTPTPSNLKTGGAGGGIGVWIQAGCGLDAVSYDGSLGTAANAAAAIAIASSYADNSIRFKKGIVFSDTSLDAAAGSTGSNQVAMEAPRNAEIRWLFNDGSDHVGGSIRSSNATAANQTRIDFSDFGVRMLGVSGAGAERVAFQVVPNPNAVNYLSTYPQATGQAPQIGPEGSDTNIDLLLAPKGSGLLALSYAATNAVTPANFSATRTIAMKFNGVTLFVPAMTTGW